MSISGIGIPFGAVNLGQAITAVIESIALEGKALSRILSSEGEIVYKAKKISNSVDEFVSLNESVNHIYNTVFRLQMLMQFELENTEQMLKKAEEYCDYDDLEE